MKTKWTKAIPELGWYWLKYKSKYGGFAIDPCEVSFVCDEKMVSIHGFAFTARTRTFFKYDSARFGPRIEIPDELAKANARLNKSLKREVRGTR